MYRKGLRHGIRSANTIRWNGNGKYSAKNALMDSNGEVIVKFCSSTEYCTHCGERYLCGGIHYDRNSYGIKSFPGVKKFVKSKYKYLHDQQVDYLDKQVVWN